MRKLPIIGRLLGHRQAETTARYAHLDRDSVRESAERVAVSIAEHILSALDHGGPEEPTEHVSSRPASASVFRAAGR